MRLNLDRLITLIAGAALWGAAFVVNASAEAEKPTPLEILAPEDVIDDYHRFISTRDPLKIEDYSGPHSRRDVVELVLVQQALSLGGNERPVKWVPCRLYKAVFSDLKQGSHVLCGTSVWERDVAAAKQLFASNVLLGDNQFVIGFYSTPNNRKALQASNLADLRALTAVSNRHWRPDWETLQGLGFKEMRDARSWETIVRILASGRADFTLAPFNASEGMRIEHGECTLLPIPNLKASLPGRRVWAVSKTHPEGTEVFEQLQAGLAKLRADGRVERAYRQCGFLNETVADWQLLVPEESVAGGL